MDQERHRHLKTLIILMICLLVMPSVLSGCSMQKEDPMADIKTFEDLNDPSYTIGVENGTIDGPVTEKRIPNILRPW